MEQAASRKILVTVGTTEFDSLIQYTLSPTFASLIRSAGLDPANITYQIGATGKIVPPPTANHFRLSPQIHKIYESHSVVFTHGGAGTLLHLLTQPHPPTIIAVANNTLADNHQTELITQLNKDKYLLGFCSIQQLKNNEHKVIQYLKGQIKAQQYPTNSKCILNNLIFGEHL